MPGTFLVRRFILHEQASITRDGNDDHGDGGFELQPKDHPGGIDRAIGIVGAGDPDDRHDDRENRKTKDEHEEDFPAKGNADAPEKSDGDNDDWDVRSAVDQQGQ